MWPVSPLEHTPQSSINALPKQSPLQSWSAFGSKSVFPSEQIPQLSIIASPSQSPLQSGITLSSYPGHSQFPVPSHIPQSSTIASPPQIPKQS